MAAAFASSFSSLSSLLPLLVVALCAVWAPCSHALTVHVQPNTEECFYEIIERAEKVLGSFSVSSGGFLDIDVRVYHPDGTIVYEDERQTEGTFTFVANQKGTYKFCWSNSMSTVTAKAVSFNVFVGNALTSHGVAKTEHFTPLEHTILRLGEGLSHVDNEQRYMTTRERMCRNTTESTNARVLWMSIIKALLLMLVVLAEVGYVKRLFEKQGKK